VVSVILFIGGGVLLDEVLDTSPTLTLIGVALALVAAGYELYELSRVGRSDTRPGPLTRQIERVAPRRSRTVGPEADRTGQE
jgi:hypothetical protein